MVRPAAGQLAPARSPRLLLVVHILTTLGVFGADLSLLVLGLASLSGAEPRMIYPAARLVAANVVAPLALGSLATGLLLARRSRWGLFRSWWVTTKLVITVVLTAVVLLVLVPRLNAAAEAATTPGATPGSLAAASAVASALLAVNVVLAVYKPARGLPRLTGRARSRLSPSRSAQP